MMASIIKWVSLRDLKFFTGDYFKDWKEEAGTNPFNKTNDKFQANQGISCIRYGGNYIDGSTSGSSSLLYRQTSKKIQPNSLDISVLMLTIILIIVCLLTPLSKGLHWMLRQEINIFFWNHKGYYYHSIPTVCKNMTVTKIRYINYVIGYFVVETLDGKFQWTKRFFCLQFSFPPWTKAPK